MFTYFDKEFDSIGCCQNYDNYFTDVILYFEGKPLKNTIRLDGLEFIDKPIELFDVCKSQNLIYKPIFNIYEVTTSDRGYDTYDSFVVIAESKKEVIEMLDNRANISTINLIGVSNEFKSRIVLSSFNAG